MKIKTVYETSKGLFWSKQEALKPKNRARYSAREDGGYGYESVREAYVLMVDVEVDHVEIDQRVRGTGTITKVFKLNHLESYEIR
jgi:hypothetical protein